MQNRFRLDFGGQKLPKTRKSYYAVNPKINQFLMIFQYFFDLFFQRVFGPFRTDFGPPAEGPKTPKNLKEGREKGMEFLVGFLEDSRAVPRRF